MRIFDFGFWILDYPNTSQVQSKIQNPKSKITLALAALLVLTAVAVPTAAIAQTDPVQKLSRRDRKDRIARLAEKYREFLTDVEPIMQPVERDAFLLLETDAQRDVYIDDFWRRRDLANGSTNQAFKVQYYARRETAKEKFKNLVSDQAKMYLLHGDPAEKFAVECRRVLQPIEIWKYFNVPGIGHQVRFLFFVPRGRMDYWLWKPTGNRVADLDELITAEMNASPKDAESRVYWAFLEDPDLPTRLKALEGARRWNRVLSFCEYAEEILAAIEQHQLGRVEYLRVFDPPAIEEEDARKVLRSLVMPNPNAAKLTAEMSVAFPAKQGAKTDLQMTLLVPRAQLTAKEVGSVTLYSIDLNGEVMRGEEMYETYRYRFDYPATTKDEKLPIVVDRFVRPGEYKSRIKVVDVHSGAEAIVERDITVPELLDTAEQRKQKEAAGTAITQIKDVIESDETRLRIVPLPDELLTGFQKIETFAAGEAIKAVEFYLDGKKIAVKRQPPYTLELDFGEVPRVRKIKAIALNQKGEPIAGDDIVLNTGNDPFRVRIVSPRLGLNLKGPTRVEMSVKAPEGKSVGAVELYLNDTRVATLYDPPFVQMVNIPVTQGVGYLRAVATLKNDPSPPVEDVVMINTPQFMEEVTVHLIELPTTVIAKGRPLTNLSESAF